MDSLGIADPFCNAGMMPDLEDIITRDKVKSTIKSPGPDGIFPALFQHTGDILHEYLVDVYRDSLRWCNVPDGWKDEIVVFIPNAGKRSHIGLKDWESFGEPYLLLRSSRPRYKIFPIIHYTYIGYVIKLQIVINLK